MPNKTIYEKALDMWGKDFQISMAQEESAELIHALCKYKRDGRVLPVIEEIADVCIMMEQLKLSFGPRHVEKAIQKKLDRLQTRISTEEALNSEN